jgi:uncharacterized membrane protein
MYNTEVRLRVVLQILAVVLLLGFAVVRFTKKSWLDDLQGALANLELVPQRVFLLSSLVFFFLAFGSKLSQASVMALNGADFWLFEDMLYWFTRGEPYITRFAPQGSGPVQHGGVHVYLSFLLTAPLAMLFGPLSVALAFNAAMISGAGYVLARIAYGYTKSVKVALALAFAFWISEWTSRILMFDMHPEAAYPLCGFLMFAASEKFAKFDSIKSIVPFVLAWMVMAAWKQDTVMVCAVIWLWFSIRRAWSIQTAVAAALAAGLPIVLMTMMVQMFKTGTLGAQTVVIGEILAVPVVLPAFGSHVVGGHQLAGVGSVFAIADFLIQKNGGLFGMFKSIASYFVTDPFLFFALTAPWLWRRLEFLILVMPMALVFAVVGGNMGVLSNYHTAPLLVGLWIAILLDLRKPVNVGDRSLHYKVAWVVMIGLVHGGSSLAYYRPSEAARETLREAKQLTIGLPGLGVVSSRLLLAVPHEQIWTDQLTLQDGQISEPPTFIRWVLFPKILPSYDMPWELQTAWRTYVAGHPEWVLRPSGLNELYVRR